MAETQPIWHVEPVDYWVHRLEQSVRMENPDLHRHGPVEICRFQEVLAEIHAHAHGRRGDTKTRQWIAEACEAIRNVPLDQPVNWRELSASMEMSYEAFRKEFRRTVEISPGKYRTQYLMNRACEFLVSEGLSIEDLSQRLGYCSSFHFSRRFKQIIGVPPSKYRAHIRSHVEL